MFDNSHRDAGRHQYVSLKPGCFMDFHVERVLPVEMAPGNPAFGGKPYEVSPMDCHVYRHTAFDKDTGKPGDIRSPNDTLRWEPASHNITGLINLADDATAKHGGDRAAIAKYKLRCTVEQGYNKVNQRYFHVYSYAALDAAGNPLPARQLPPAPTVAAGHDAGPQSAPAQQQYQQQHAPAPAAAPAYTPLDELRESLTVVADFPQLQQAWAAVSQRLAAAGLVPQAQALVTPVKRRLLLAEIARHADGQMLTQAKADIIRRCGADGALAAEISAACDRRIAETTDTGFAFGANVGGGVDDIPL